MYKIIHSDVYAGLSKLQNNSIDLAVTSPPYWGQRDYGFKGQIGNETTHYEYIDKLVFIYSVLRQKMKKTGVFFLNIGDKYLSKYGKSPLGMIPFKLAYFMILDGWILNDIIIWYKPNHMPSSIKNRFVNSYEPIFVFSKDYKNIFKEYQLNNNNYSNILKVNLQPTPYNHVAVYPEKLIKKLLNMVYLRDNSIILDPFAGSGTTLKVIQDMNNSLYSKNLSGIMIERSKEYIEIIKKRCLISSSNVVSYKFLPYHYKFISDKEVNRFNFKKELLNNQIVNDKINKNGFFKIFNRKKDYYKTLSLFIDGRIKNNLNNDATCFIGAKEFDITLIYNTSLLNNHGWVIRNMLIVEENNKWLPLFMIVDDNKSVRYRFNYKKLNLIHKYKNEKKWGEVNFIGYKVIDNLRKEKLEGIIIKVLDRNSVGFPKYVIVKWQDGTYTKEFVIYSNEEVNNNLILTHNNNIPVIKEKTELIKINNMLNLKEDINIKYIPPRNNSYNGKFKNEKRKNWGASPGARASLEQTYFSKKKLYKIKQPIIADYLNLKRKEKKMSKKDLTKLFPKSYKHTIGHWLRKDLGGSIPLPEDWQRLVKILNLDKNFTNVICKAGLKLQIVKNSHYKLPEDYIPINFLPKIEQIIN